MCVGVCAVCAGVCARVSRRAGGPVVPEDIGAAACAVGGGAVEAERVLLALEAEDRGQGPRKDWAGGGGNPAEHADE